MPKLNIFQITLNSPNAVYMAGMPVEGYVTVELNDSMKMRGIRLRFCGAANVHWTERHSSGSGKNRKTTTRHYRSNETYFNQTVVLFGKAEGQSGDDPVLDAGRYTYPFIFNLPQNLPSSFEGAHGRVRYSLNGCIDKPWKFDHNCSRAFTVLSILDLNVQPNALEPQHGKAEKRLCCLCCQSDPIKAEFNVDRRGYVPGEYITINGHIENGSNRVMNCSKVQLLMRTVFHATRKSRAHLKEVTHLRKGQIRGGGTEEWNGERLHIPPLPPSALVHCKIIDIKYFLMMVVDPTGIGFDLEVPLEIVLGTIPLQNVYSSFATGPAPLPPAPGTLYDDTAVSSAQAPPPMAPQAQAGTAANMPPPSYAQCVLGGVNIKEEEGNEHMRGQVDYTPTYTYYNWNQPGQSQPGQGQPGGQPGQAWVQQPQVIERA